MTRASGGLDTRFRNDVFKILFLLALLGAIGAVFFMTPVLSTPTLLSIITSLLLSPVVAAIERRGLSRGSAIGIVFAAIGIVLTATTVLATQSITSEWHSFRDEAPRLFHASLERFRSYEADLKDRFPILGSVQLTASLTTYGEQTGKWFITHGPSLMGQLLTWLLVVPLLTFGLLSDGRTLQKKFFEMIPNRFFESSFIITTRIMTSLSDYLRAKLIEAFLVGLLTTVGLLIFQAPYAIVLGAIAGITNILPYVGPIIGAVPGLLIAAFAPAGSDLLWQIGLVYAVANVIDMAVIFPVVVAKLVNLHPVLLVIVVMLGQEYYGLVGMLISIPIATGVKIVIQEVSAAVNQQNSSRSTSVPV